MSPAASTRWCPTPEQVMILEEMYRGGVRTPNASHIQQITAHLSHYGKIEGKNVFYWFQNHKARDRQKIRKRLLGKQVHVQNLHHFDHFMLQIPCTSSTTVDHPHFQHPHTFLHQQQLHHFDQLPCCTSSSTTTNLGFQPLSPFLTSPYFPAHHQPRTEDTLTRMANSCAWKGGSIHAKFGVENDKTLSINNDNNRVIMREDRDCDYNYNYDYDYDYDYDGDDYYYDNNADYDEDSIRRPLKTLELFPIKDKTSLKKDVQPDIISFVKL